MSHRSNPSRPCTWNSVAASSRYQLDRVSSRFVEEPLDRIDIDANVDRMRLETHRLQTRRRGRNLSQLRAATTDPRALARRKIACQRDRL